MTDTSAQNANREAMLDASDRLLDNMAANVRRLEAAKPTIEQVTSSIKWYVGHGFNADSSVDHYARKDGVYQKVATTPPSE